MKWDKPEDEGIVCTTDGFLDLCIKLSKESQGIRPEFKLDDNARKFFTIFADNGARTGRIDNDDMHLASFMFIHGYNCAMEALFK
jgi:hypothetical protein